jgi:hypothetical protein
MAELPPGPKSIGFVDFFRSAFHTAAPVFKKFTAEYGGTFRVPTEQGPVTFTGDPEVIRAIYTMEPGSFTMRAVEVASPVFGRSSVVVTGGSSRLRSMRVRCAPTDRPSRRRRGLPRRGGRRGGGSRC